MRITTSAGTPPPRVAESRSDVNFLQHKNLFREEVIIRATNNLNLQHNKLQENVARITWPLERF